MHALNKLEKGSDKTHHSIRTEADSRAHWDHLQSTVIASVFVSNTPPQGLSVPTDLLLNDERKEKEKEEEEEEDEEQEEEEEK